MSAPRAESCMPQLTPAIAVVSDLSPFQARAHEVDIVAQVLSGSSFDQVEQASRPDGDITSITGNIR